MRTGTVMAFLSCTAIAACAMVGCGNGDDTVSTLPPSPDGGHDASVSDGASDAAHEAGTAKEGSAEHDAGGDGAAEGDGGGDGSAGAEGGGDGSAGAEGGMTNDG